MAKSIRKEPVNYLDKYTGNTSGSGKDLIEGMRAFRATRPAHDLSVLNRDVATMPPKLRKKYEAEQKALRELGAQDV